MIGPEKPLYDSYNYSKSPAGKHALVDGSLDQKSKATFSTTLNRKIKMRDTFTSVFPTYNHGEPTVYSG